MSTNHKLVLWDLDGTLCLHNAGFFRLAPEAVAQAALDLKIPLSAADAAEFAKQNFAGQRGCVRAFAARFDLDEDELFARYYEHLSSDFLECPDGLLQAFKHSTHCLSHGVLTHAPESWARRALKKLGLWGLFDPDCIWGREHMNACHKTDAAGLTSLQGLLQQSRHSPQNVVLVDDKLVVLEALRPCANTLIWINPDAADAPGGIRAAPSARAALDLI